MDQQSGKRFPQEGKELLADGLTKPLQGQPQSGLQGKGTTSGCMIFEFGLGSGG